MSAPVSPTTSSTRPISLSCASTTFQAASIMNQETGSPWFIGRSPADEQWKGRRGKPGGFPAYSPQPTGRSQRRGGSGVTERRGPVGETWFPLRERAEGEPRSSRNCFQGSLQLFERAHDDGAVAGGAQRVTLACDEVEEVLALEAKRLEERNLRAVDVPGPRAPFSEGRRRLLGCLGVHRHLALQLHVVEHGHLVAADDGDPADLVRVEPREVEVRDLPRWKTQVAEDDVLNPWIEECVAVRPDLARLLVDQEEEHREVVHAE